MKGGWPFWLFIALLVVGHFFLHLSFGFAAEAPDLLTVATLLGARQLTGGRAAGLGFLLGLLEDAVSLGAFGASTVALTLMGYIGARSRDLFVGESLLFLGIYLFLGKWLRDALYYVLADVVRRGDPLGTLLVRSPMAALYAAAAGVVAVLIYRSLSRRR